MIEKNVLVVSYHAVQPDRDSGARRIFHLIELLQEMGWLVTFLAADGVGELHDVRALEHRGVAVYDGQSTDIAEVLSAGPFELALIGFWPNAERYVPAIRELSPTTRVIVDSIDLHFVREARRAFSGPAKGNGAGLTGADAARMAAELNTYAGADAVLTVSQKEADLIGDLIGDPTRSTKVPDFEDSRPPGQTFDGRRGIVSVGSFQHLPNVDAVEFLCREILPLVDPALLEEHPVWIVGNCLNEKVRAFGRDLPQVRMVGWVPSVLPYLDSARVSVVPLLYGAGTKRKLIQALVAGTPTVSTTIGVEGLDLQADRHVLVADDPAAFAQGITRLLTESRLWETLSRAGRAHVAATNGRDEARRRFSAALEDVLTRRPKGSVVETISSPVHRLSPDDYLRVVDDVKRSATRVLPADAHVLVVSRGDDRLLDLGCTAWHFPRHPDGRWGGYHPGSSADALEHLRSLEAKGADHVLFPGTSRWWLEHYTELKDHLDTHCALVHEDTACTIFRLRARARPDAEVPVPRLTSAAAASPPTAAQPPAAGADVKVIAFYLPQFHPIPENDRWWGEGFTEWRNVARAKSQFAGHYQPHLPADLGFYDLRLAETRRQQADLARAYGIHGFCYYHYWFGSKMLLERPFNEVLESGEPDFPFCLCWGNDPWSRRWDGRTDDLLQDQTYGTDDDIAHIRWLLPALEDPRAITVDGRPMFLVYRASHLPDAERTCDTWRREVERAGLPGIHLVAVETAWELGWDATRVGFDAKVLFQPQFAWLMTHARSRNAGIEVPGKDHLQVYDYNLVVDAIQDIEPVAYRRYESVFPRWDNTPRVGERAVILHDSTPERYGEWLHRALSKARLEPPPHRLVFLNAWNEWAEGCHLEPDLRHGHAYLEATRRAIAAPPVGSSAPHSAHRDNVPAYG